LYFNLTRTVTGRRVSAATASAPDARHATPWETARLRGMTPTQAGSVRMRVR